MTINLLFRVLLAPFALVLLLTELFVWIAIGKDFGWLTSSEALR